MTRQAVAVGPRLPTELGVALRTAFRDGDPRALIFQLEAAIALPVTGLVVYGSQAHRSPSDGIGDSDVDLLVLVDEPAEGGVFGTADGIQVDLHVQSRAETFAEPSINCVYWEGRALFDLRAPEVEDWLKSLRHWRAVNVDPWTAVDLLRDRVWAERLVERVALLASTEPAIAAMHEARLLATIPTLHAQLKRTRTTSIGQWWSNARRSDPGFASAVETYLTTRTALPNGAALKSLIARLYAGHD